MCLSARYCSVLQLYLTILGYRIHLYLFRVLDKFSNRHRMLLRHICRKSKDQPRWRELTNFADIDDFIREVGYPVLVRPSYVLSGAAMNVCSNEEDIVSTYSFCGGNWIVASPECTPANSICSDMAYNFI